MSPALKGKAARGGRWVHNDGVGLVSRFISNVELFSGSASCFSGLPSLSPSGVISFEPPFPRQDITSVLGLGAGVPVFMFAIDE